MKEKFSNLSPQIQLIFSSIPIYVSTTQDPDVETEQQAIEMQNKFIRLPKNVRWKLASFETGEKIKSIGRKYSFDLLRLANITRLIREYYFGEVRLEDFPKEIEKRMGVSLLTAQEITRYIKTEIIDWDPWKEYLDSLPKQPIREILKNFPQVGNQEISSGYLELKGWDDLFEGTIRNWLQDYVLHLGQERHGNIDRVNYLFHTENTKDLSSPEREKLGIILKSFDENIPLPVDTENNEIVFEGVLEEKVPRPEFAKPAPVVAPAPQAKPIPKVRPYNQGSAFSEDSKIRPFDQSSTAVSRIRPFDKGSTFSLADKSANSSRSNLADKIQFINPYPSPGKHEMPPSPEVEDSGSGSPFIVKGLESRQKTAAINPPAPSRSIAAPKPSTPFSAKPSPQDFIRRHPKNIIHPHYRPEQERPEPKINGNIVDLSNKDDYAV